MHVVLRGHKAVLSDSISLSPCLATQGRRRGCAGGLFLVKLAPAVNISNLLFNKSSPAHRDQPKMSQEQHEETSLPSTMRALVLENVGQPLILKTVPTPTPIPGTVIIKVICALVDQNLPRILSGEAGFTYPLPLTPGGRAIGRIAGTGIDTTTFEVGQLVMLEPMIHARDDPDLCILLGAADGWTSRGAKFMRDNWTMAGFAEYVRAPLENTWALDENRFCGSPTDGGMGLEVYDLLQLPTQLTVYGGLRGINLQPGERVIVSPATGGFSGAAVAVASAMGANVIAASRNLEIMKQLQATFPRVSIVQLKGDEEEDTRAMKQFGPVDAYIDLSSPVPNGSTHARSAFKALKFKGRASLMGALFTDIPVSGGIALLNNLTIQGQYMYAKEDVAAFIKLAESGLLKLGKEGGVDIVGKFGLDEIEKAFETAQASHGAGKLCMLVP